MNSQLINAVIQTTRPSFLILGPICILLALSIPNEHNPWASPLLVSLIFIGALCAHISVNALNEYHDFHSGLDFNTQRTPFSGGSGGLPGYPQAANAVLGLGIVTLFITALVGLYILIERTQQILPIGLLGMVIVVLYTKWINKMPLLCLIAPGLGFGTFMVLGTQIALTGDYSHLSWLISFVPFCLTNNLLLLNQYPDMKADADAGRRTFPIVFGINLSNLAYGMFIVGAFGTIIWLVQQAQIPSLCLLALLPMAASLFALIGAIKHGDNIAAHPQHLAANVMAALLTPLILAITLLLA